MLTKQQTEEATAEFIKTCEMITDTTSKMKSKQEIILYLTSVKDWTISAIHSTRAILPR